MWEKTVWTWSRGPQMVGFSMMHIYPLIAIGGMLGCLSVMLCVLSAGLRNRKILGGIGEGNGPFQGFAIVPRHPLRRFSLHILSMALQLGQVVEGVGAAQLTSVY
jgi:hypothetical protein